MTRVRFEQILARAAPANPPEAGVSLATVCIYVPGKAAIVEANGRRACRDARPQRRTGGAGRDPVRQVRRGAGIIRRLNQRAWLLADILRSARGTDERLAQVWAVWQRRHLEANRRVVEALEASSGFRPGLPADEAVDFLYAICGTDVYRALVRERGWSPARYQQWLFQLGCSELLGQPAHVTRLTASPAPSTQAAELGH